MGPTQRAGLGEPNAGRPPSWTFGSVSNERVAGISPSETLLVGGLQMPVWAWILIIVLVVLLLTGGIYVRR
jgi:hypothetical protein